MAKVAHEQEILEARVGEAEKKRKLTKRALREVLETGMAPESPSLGGPTTEEPEEIGPAEGVQLPQKSPIRSATRRQTALDQIANLSDSGEEEEEEFFDAVDAGAVQVTQMPPSEVAPSADLKAVVTSEVDISSSFKGYENGIRKKLKMDADDRPKISLWVSSPTGRPVTELLTHHRAS
jgi:hypothetical protein